MVQRIAVLGAGQMGAGIAQVAAAAGYDVVLRDVKQEFVDRGFASIRGSLEKLESKGKVPAGESARILSRIRGTLSPRDAADADLVVEAIVEDVAAKRELWRELDAACKREAIFASNTSSISITLLASATRRPERFVGMHFFNPVPVMKLVEVIRGEATDDATTKAVMDAAVRMGKTPVEVHDYPGFVSNRVLMPMINEAIFALQEGVAGRDEIDTVMKLGMNHPMGPLELADFIGLDTCLAILRVLHDGFGDPKYRPCPLLVRKVQAGHLGRKSGRGFYAWDEKGAQKP